MPDTPPRQKFPWKAMALPLGFIGLTVVLALVLMINRVGLIADLIAIQIEWLGGYYPLATFAIIWIVLVGCIGGVLGIGNMLLQRIRPK